MRLCAAAAGTTLLTQDLSALTCSWLFKSPDGPQEVLCLQV
jgi:hypothetical protein